MNRALVTFNAGVLRDTSVARFDANGLVKVVEREGKRMKEPVVGFRDPFANGVMGKVAIDANRGRVMTRVLPRIIIILHYVAVHARNGVAAHVARAVPVAESEKPESARKAQRSRENEINAAGDGVGTNSTFGFPGFHGGDSIVAAR